MSTLDQLRGPHADLVRETLHEAISLSFQESRYLHSYGSGDRQSVDYALDRMEFDSVEETTAFINALILSAAMSDRWLALANAETIADMIHEADSTERALEIARGSGLAATEEEEWNTADDKIGRY